MASKLRESSLKHLLGDKTKFQIDGHEIDILLEASLPKDVEIEDLLQDHPERVAMWERYITIYKRKVEKAEDELEEWRARRYTHYWAELEINERKEMQEHLHDENEVQKDKFLGSKSREKRAAYRVQNGVDAGRWHRNFSEGLVNGFVETEEKVVTLKTALRQAKYNLSIGYAMRDTLKARGVSLNHLSALHRDLTKS